MAEVSVTDGYVVISGISGHADAVSFAQSATGVTPTTRHMPVAWSGSQTGRSRPFPTTVRR